MSTIVTQNITASRVLTLALPVREYCRGNRQETENHAFGFDLREIDDMSR
jgi:hypothetical protein